MQRLSGFGRFAVAGSGDQGTWTHCTILRTDVKFEGLCFWIPHVTWVWAPLRAALQAALCPTLPFKLSPQERFRTVQNGSELLWGCLRMVFGALFDGVFVWFLILNPIPLLVYYLRSVLHLHSVLPFCGSTSGRRFSLIYCGLFAGICYLMSRKTISKHLQTSESK